MTNGKDILDANMLLARAQAQTGLNDWGDDTLRERFGLAIDFLKSCNMDEAGQRAGADTCLRLLTSRLAFFEDFKRYPIASEKIVQPLFVTGEMRSGTTLLQALLSVDPNARALRFWEVMYPSPPPGLAAPDDPRPAKADADWREINTKMAFFLKSRPYWDMLGNGLPEDQCAWAFDFRMMTPTSWWRVPFGMNIAGLPQYARAEYRVHKMMLQQLQHARPQKYWVLKGFHGSRLAELFETYPDAKIIWIHRDPVQALASRIVIMGEMVEGLTGHVDWKEQAGIHLAACRAGFKAILSNPVINDPRIHHVRYPDFIGDPVGILHGFYEKYSVPFNPNTETAMRDYLQNNRSDRYGKFEYSTDVIGEDIEALHEEFAPYRQRFGLEIEQRHVSGSRRPINLGRT
jgi:Sulfotransferase family